MVLDKGCFYKFFIINCILCNNSFNLLKNFLKISNFFGILISKVRVLLLVFLKFFLDESYDCLGYFYYLNRKIVKEINNNFIKVFCFVIFVFLFYI